MDKQLNNTTELQVNFFKTSSGREPVREWLLSLDKDNRRSVGADIRTIQYRWPLGMPLVRKMGDHLWEVRSHIENGISRVLFTVDENQIYLLHGFIKKSNRTPASDLRIAKERLAELRRNSDGK
jgi:phage-related protein